MQRKGIGATLIWIDRLDRMSLLEKLPLGESTKSAVYGAVHKHKGRLAGRKFRVTADKDGSEFVCRVR